MARINIENSIWSDEKFFQLSMKLGNRALAIGELVILWNKSQEQYLTTDGWLSSEQFAELNLSEHVKKSGFVEIDSDNRIRPKNISKHFGWIKDKQIAGRKGGKASWETRREIIREFPKHIEAERSILNPPSPSPSPSLKKEEVSDLERSPKLPQLARIWNQYKAKPFAEVKRVGPSRKKFADTRWRENPDEKYWIEVVQRISKSEFCLGKNNRSWLACFDFLIRPETHIKVLEGKYDNKTKINTALDEKQNEENKKLMEEIWSTKT